MARFKETRFGARSSENPMTVALEDGDGSVSRYSFTAVSGDATVQFKDDSGNVGSSISVTSGSTATGPSSDLSGTGSLSMEVTFDASGFRTASYLEVDVETVSDAELEIEPWVPSLGAADGDLIASDGAGGIKAVSSGAYASQAEVDAVAAETEEAARRPPVLSHFMGGGDTVALSRDGDNYVLEQHLGEQRWIRTRFESQAGLPGGGNLVRRLTGGMNVEFPAVPIQEDDASVATAGTGWGQSSNVNAFGGTYMRPTAAGATMTWTTPASTRRAGLHMVTLTGGGIAKVTIDGDTTRADLLPTAQELVDDGAPNTILAANGGPFQPTDRVLDFYTASTVWDTIVPLADDLAPDSHTVVIEMTAASQTAATDSRIYISGFFYATPSTTIDTTDADWHSLANLTEIPAGLNVTTHEYAILCAPSGGTDTWVGGSHGYETEDALTFAIDGGTVALADGARQEGTALVVTRTTSLYHPDVGSGATVIADVTTTYRVDGDGLRVTPTVAWSEEITVTRAYFGMFTGNGEILTKGAIPAAGADIDLTVDDGSFHGKARSSVAYLWGSRVAVALWLPDAATAMGEWLHSLGSASLPSYMAIEDRTSATSLSHKIYPTRVSDGAEVDVSDGDEWVGAFVHVAQWFTVAADNVLSRS